MPTTPATEATFTITPEPASSISGKIARVNKNGPVRLVPMTRFQFAVREIDSPTAIRDVALFWNDQSSRLPARLDGGNRRPLPRISLVAPVSSLGATERYL